MGLFLPSNEQEPCHQIRKERDSFRYSRFLSGTANLLSVKHDEALIENPDSEVEV